MRFLILLLLPLSLAAEEIRLSCTPPTQNEDGSELTDLAGFKFYEAQVDGGPYTQVGEAPECALSLERGPGTWYYVATAYNTAGTESNYSNQAQKTVQAQPAPPTDLTADAASVAFAIQQTPDNLTLYPVGLVREDTPCDPWIRVANASHTEGLSLIPRDSVAFAAGADARTVFAACAGG